MRCCIYVSCLGLEMLGCYWTVFDVFVFGYVVMTGYVVDWVGDYGILTSWYLETWGCD